jgi:hypothetical protein
MHKLALVLIGVCIGSSVSLCLSPEFIKTVHAVRLHEPIHLDGVLSESVWQQHGTTAFFQQEPNQGQPVSEPTEVWVAYDDEAVYIAARLQDSHPDSIIDRLSRRDNDIGADDFTVGIDPYHDKRNGFYFTITAGGTLLDGICYNDDWTDNSWDGVWDAKRQITADGWTVEMRIPFSQLHLEKGDRYVLGIDFKRTIARKKEQALLAYTPRNESGSVSRFPDLEGIENIAPPSRLEILPYVNERAEYSHPSAGDPFNNGSKYSTNVGADFKLGLGHNVMFEGSVNPDFGQVEVDPAVVNLSDVETIYSEKRPFFLEGTNIFSYGQGGVNNFWNFNWSAPSLFYTRRIGRAPQRDLSGFSYDYSDIPAAAHILGAGKLTGKVCNGWDIGVIEAVTKREYGDLGTDTSRWNLEVEPLTSYTVGRIQRDFNGGKQGFGLLTTYTKRSFDNQLMRADVNKDGFVAGLDGWTSLDSSKEYMVSGWTAFSRVSGSTERMISLQQSSAHYYQRPDAGYVSVDSNATSMSGYAGRFIINKQRGRVMLNSALGFISPGFESGDLGYVRRADVINFHIGTGYKWDDPTPSYRYLRVYGTYFGTKDFGGDMLVHGVWGQVAYELPAFQTIVVSCDHIFEGVDRTLTRGGPLALQPRMEELNFSFYTDSRNDYIGEAYWYGYKSSAGYGQTTELIFTMRPLPNFSIVLDPVYNSSFSRDQWIGNYVDMLAAETYNHRYVFADLRYNELSLTTRLNWTLTPALSFQVYLQPFISSGKYSKYKILKQARTLNFKTFGEEGSSITETAGADGAVDSYSLDPDGSGAAPSINVTNPDFAIVSLRGNAVLRWEYLPGSTVYLVWTQNRYDNNGTGDFQFARSFDRLSIAKPDNVLMLKIAYWLGR